MVGWTTFYKLIKKKLPKHLTKLIWNMITKKLITAVEKHIQK